MSRKTRGPPEGKEEEKLCLTGWWDQKKKNPQTSDQRETKKIVSVNRRPPLVPESEEQPAAPRSLMSTLGQADESILSFIDFQRARSSIPLWYLLLYVNYVLLQQIQSCRPNYEKSGSLTQPVKYLHLHVDFRVVTSRMISQLYVESWHVYLESPYKCNIWRYAYLFNW